MREETEVSVKDLPAGTALHLFTKVDGQELFELTKITRNDIYGIWGEGYKYGAVETNSTTSCGPLLDTVHSTEFGEYPSSGEQGGYWYEYVGVN